MTNRPDNRDQTGFESGEHTAPGIAPEHAPSGDFDEEGGTIVDGEVRATSSGDADPDPSLFPDPEDTLPPGAAQEIQDELERDLRKQHISEMGAPDDPIPEPLPDTTRPDST